MSGFEWLASSGVIVAMIVLIAILAVWRTTRDRRSGFPAADERTQVIAGRAARMALNIGWVFVLAIMFWSIVAREFLGMPSFGEDYYSYSLIAVLLFQSISFALIRWYLDRKGEP